MSISFLIFIYQLANYSMSKRPRRDSDVDYSENLELNPKEVVINCSIPPCHLNPTSFNDYLTYEAHIVDTHNYLCLECQKRFPSEAFLNIHIDENHNPFFEIRKEKGEKVYKCFNYSLSDGCKKVCIDRRKRRLHMIDKHAYPRNFNFGVVDSGIDPRKPSLLK